MSSSEKPSTLLQLSTPSNPEFVVYRNRWLILLLFSLATLSNASMWTTLAPISSDASRYFFDNDPDRKQTINVCSLMYQITYLPGTLAASVATERGGLRKTIVTGSLFTAFGSLVRYFSVSFLGGSTTSYVIVVIGQSFAAFGQPFFVNSPGLLAANWFGTGERDTATSIASLFAVVGNAVGQVVPPALVTSKYSDVTSKSSDVNGMANLMLVQAVIAVVLHIFVHLFFKENPPTPPSQSTADRDRMKSEKQQRLSSASRTLVNGVDGAFMERPLLTADEPTVIDKTATTSMKVSLLLVKRQITELIDNKDYVILLAAFGVGLALFNGLLTCINNFLEPCDYSEDDAGNFAASLIACGLIGAIFTGALMEIYKCYKFLLKFLYILGAIAAGVLCINVDRENERGLLISFGALGFVMIPMLPVIIENAIETTYPISEELSSGLLFTVGNVIGIPMTFLMQFLIDLQKNEDVCGQWFSAVNILIFSTSVLCGFAALFFNGTYKRQLAEQPIAIRE